jgi:hypothetical protein
MPFTRKLPPQDEGESWMSSSQGSIPAEGRKQEEDFQAAGLGVFPSFIADIFIDDVLRSLHHPYVLQSVSDDGVMSPFVPRVRWMHDM